MIKTKLIVFDAYGVTFTGGYPDTMKALGKKFKRDWKELYKIIYTKYLNLAAMRKITQKEAWEKAVKELGLPMHWHEVRDLHYSLLGINKPMMDFAKKIGKETNTLLLSKNTRTQFTYAEKAFGFKKYFKYVINTWELNIPKASKKTIRYIFKRFKVKPKEIIYIDDQDSNLTAARELGVHTILFKNFKQFKKEFYKVYKKNGA
jgi:putative hydrolase of the HAD superfamily